MPGIQPHPPGPRLSSAPRSSFLDEQYGRIIGMWPDKELTPQHRIGLWNLLRHAYQECYLTQRAWETPPAQAEKLASTYIAYLEPSSFRKFCLEVNRAATTPPELLALSPVWARTILPVVKSVSRDLKGFENTSVADRRHAARESAVLLRKKLIEHQGPSLLPGISLEPVFDKIVEARFAEDLFFTSMTTAGRVPRPGEIADRLAKHLLGLHIGSAARASRERLRRRARTGWRVKTWETVDAERIADRLKPFPNPPKPS